MTYGKIRRTCSELTLVFHEPEARTGCAWDE